MDFCMVKLSCKSEKKMYPSLHISVHIVYDTAFRGSLMSDESKVSVHTEKQNCDTIFLLLIQIIKCEVFPKMLAIAIY